VEPLFGLVVAAITASIVYLATSERRRAHLRIWRQAATRVELTEVEEGEGGLFEGGFVSGRSGLLRVRLESYRRGKYENGTRIVVTGLGHGAGGLSLRREGLSTAFEKRFIGEREIEIGDPSFDAEYYVQGRAPLALALLDPETRRRLAALLRGRVALAGRGPIEVDPSLSDGILEVRVKESGFSDKRERVPEILAGVLEVAQRLVAPADVAARIASNLRAEPEAGARLRGVLMLSASSPTTRRRGRRCSRPARTRARRCACARGWRSARRGAGRSSTSWSAPAPTTRARRARSRRSGSGCRRNGRRRRCGAPSEGPGARRRPRRASRRWDASGAPSTKG
jgi:hypothetical protein